MDDLENKVIVFDDACPMCKAYTASFVKLGWLEKRTGFSTANPELLAHLDLHRSRHEIPLVDTATGEVRYGLDALFFILGKKMPMLKPLFGNRLFRAFWRQVYQVITFNRRIIAASEAPADGFDCAPDLNVRYRWVYIAFAVISSAGLLALSADGFYLALAHAGLLSAVLLAGKKLDFLGHWATVLLINSLLAAILPANWLTRTLLLCLNVWMWPRRWRQVASD